jgi:hypothetical protein
VRIKPGRDGAVTIQLDPAEVQLLRDLPEQLRLLYDAEPDDPARARLFPRAYLDPTEEAAEAEWQAAVHPDLLAEKLAGLDRLAGALDAAEVKGRRARLVLPPDEVSVWLAVLNDARLAFGSRLGITDDTDVYRFAPDDPLALEKAAYAWLTTLQGALVEALLATSSD